MDNSTKTALASAFIAGIFALAVAFVPSMQHFWENKPPEIISFKSTALSPQESNTSITFTVRAFDPDNDQIYCKFQLCGPSTQNQFADQQNWSTKNEWIWHTKDLDIGNNSIRVQIKDKKHVKSDEGDVENDISNFVITRASNADDWFDLGEDLFNKRKYNDAIYAYQKAIEINPNYEYAWSAMAGAFVNLNKNEEGLNASEKAIELNQNDSTSWNNKAAALVNLGRNEEGLRASEKAIELENSYALAWYNKGRALRALGRTSEANAAFAKAEDLGYEA